MHRAGLASIALLLLLAGPLAAWSQGTQIAPGEEDATAAQWLVEGERLVRQNRQPEAILLYFDRTATAYESRYRDPKIKYFCSRSMVEALLYVTESALANKGDAVVCRPIGLTPTT